MKHKAAAFTIVQNETERLPKWAEHYLKQFDGYDDIYVLDHFLPGPSCIRVLECVNKVPVYNSQSFSHAWLRDTVQDFQRFLFNSYQCVLFSEVDELIVHERGLSTFIDDFLASPQAVARCRGVEIVERDGKPSYEESRFYQKTLIAKTPILWMQGFHNANIEPAYFWPGLWLIHTHRQNYAACRQRHKETAARKWSQKDIATGAGAHNRIQTDAEFEAWFYRHDGPVVELPEAVLKQLPRGNR